MQRNSKFKKILTDNVLLLTNEYKQKKSLLKVYSILLKLERGADNGHNKLVKDIKWEISDQE